MLFLLEYKHILQIVLVRFKFTEYIFFNFCENYFSYYISGKVKKIYIFKNISSTFYNQLSFTWKNTARYFFAFVFNNVCVMSTYICDCARNFIKYQYLPWHFHNWKSSKTSLINIAVVIIFFGYDHHVVHTKHVIRTCPSTIFIT